MSLRVRVVVCVLSLCAVEAQLLSQAAPDPWFAKSAKPRDFEAPRLPWNNFTIELPKNWQLLPGHNGILLSAAEKTRSDQPAAVIMLEQMRLQDSLLPKDLSEATLGFEAAIDQGTRSCRPEFSTEHQVGQRRPPIHFHSVPATRLVWARPRHPVLGACRFDAVPGDLYRSRFAARKVPADVRARRRVVQADGRRSDQVVAAALSSPDRGHPGG